MAEGLVLFFIDRSCDELRGTKKGDIKVSCQGLQWEPTNFFLTEPSPLM